MRTTLVEKSAGTKAGLIDATESLLTQQTFLATKLGELEEAEAGLDVIEREMAKTRGAFTAENLQKLGDAERQVDDLEQRLTKAKARRDHMVIRSPIAGTVQGSSVTSVGQVATVGEELMRIVPDGSTLEIEAYLLNKDIGFVQAGQQALIRVESLPFTRYGTVDGIVTRVANDAIPEPEAQQVENGQTRAVRSGAFIGGGQRTQNLVFPATIIPSSLSVPADGRDVALSSGMAVSIEIKTGRRRIIEYLFSPLVEVTAQSFHER